MPAPSVVLARVIIGNRSGRCSSDVDGERSVPYGHQPRAALLSSCHGAVIRGWAVRAALGPRRGVGSSCTHVALARWLSEVLIPTQG